MKLANDTFIKALLRQDTDYTPVWLMRQAGRYLPEYRQVRANAGGFMDLCRNKDFATVVTLQPVERFNLDAAILFSDILTVPDAMGLGLSFVAGEGPKFAHPIQDENAVKQLAVPDMEKLSYVFNAVASIKQALNGRVPLIGFSGSPWTLACYMVEGGSSREFRLIKSMLYSRPDLLHRVLEINAQAVTAYLNQQIAAGANAVQIFDTWGGVLSDKAFGEFSLQYITKIINGLTKTDADGNPIPVIVFVKGGGLWLERMANCGADALGLDWTVDIAAARRLVGDKVALQGNFDPMALFGTKQAVEAEVARILAGYGKGNGHIFNLGHGIHQLTDPERMKDLVEAVHSLSKAYH